MSAQSHITVNGRSVSVRALKREIKALKVQLAGIKAEQQITEPEYWQIHDWRDCLDAEQDTAEMIEWLVSHLPGVPSFGHYSGAPL
jgi:hypothetical protein